MPQPDYLRQEPESWRPAQDSRFKEPSLKAPNLEQEQIKRIAGRLIVHEELDEHR